MQKATAPKPPRHPTVLLSTSVIFLGVLVACLPSISVPEASKILCDTSTDCPSDFVCVAVTQSCVANNSSCVVEGTPLGEAVNEEGDCQTEAGGQGVCTRGRCKIPVCGDGEIDPTLGEECDDGDDNSDAPNACRTNCSLPTCGDFILDAGEQCDGTGEVESCADGCYLVCPIGEVSVERAGECSSAISRLVECVGVSNVAARDSDAYGRCIGRFYRTTPDGLVTQMPELSAFANGPIAVSESVLASLSINELSILSFTSNTWSTFPVPFSIANKIVARESSLWIAGNDDEVVEVDATSGAMEEIAAFERGVTHLSLSSDSNELLVGTFDGELVVIDLDTRGIASRRQVDRGIGGAVLTKDTLYWLDRFDAGVWKVDREAETAPMNIANGEGNGFDLILYGDSLFFLAGFSLNTRLFEVPASPLQSVIPRAIASLSEPSSVAVFDDSIIFGDAELSQATDPETLFPGGFYRIPRTRP